MVKFNNWSSQATKGSVRRETLEEISTATESIKDTVKDVSLDAIDLGKKGVANVVDTLSTMIKK